MFCYMCGEKAEKVQQIVDFDNGNEAISVKYVHCGKQWIVNAAGNIIAAGTVDPSGNAKDRNDEN